MLINMQNKPVTFGVKRPFLVGIKEVTKHVSFSILPIFA